MVCLCGIFGITLRLHFYTDTLFDVQSLLY